MENLIENKLRHYNLNLDYSMSQMSLENQTNMLINFIINDFIKTYQNKFDTHIFVYEYNDDLLSLIGYKILQSIKAVCSNFTFVLYGKKKKTKKYLDKKIKFQSKRKIIRNYETSIIISGFNPIYNVMNKEYKSKIFSQSITAYPLVKKFTPEEIYMAQVFYHIGYIKEKEDYREINGRFSQSINNLVQSKISENVANTAAPAQGIILAWFDEDVNNNIKIMQDLQDFDGLIYYYFGNKLPPILQDVTYNILLKRTTNRPNEKFLNLNNYTAPAAIVKEYPTLQCQIKGNWPNDKLEEVLK